MEIHSDYTAAWRDYRKRRLVSWAVLLAYIPGVLVLFFGIGLPISVLTGIKPDYFFYLIAGSWMLACVIMGLRTELFHCPRCGKRFFATWWYHNAFARKCVHCGLPKWANTDLPTERPP